MIYVGIDPGLYGAIAFIDEAGEALRVEDTPVLLLKRSGKNERHVLDEDGMVALLASWPATELRVILEQVGPMPKQGLGSTFNFGDGFGCWKGILAGMRLKRLLVRPQRWQADMLDGVPRCDGASLIVARRRFPRVDLHRKKDHGRADALLLAEYGRTRAFAAAGAGA